MVTSCTIIHDAYIIRERQTSYIISLVTLPSTFSYAKYTYKPHRDTKAAGEQDERYLTMLPRTHLMLPSQAEENALKEMIARELGKQRGTDGEGKEG